MKLGVLIAVLSLAAPLAQGTMADHYDTSKRVSFAGTIPSLSVRGTGEAGYLFSVPSSTIKSIVFEQQDDERKRCEAERARPRAGFDFVIVDFRVTNTGQLPNCTVFDATLKTDYFGEITREQTSSRLGLERLAAGSEVAVNAVFEIARQREPLGVMLSAHSDDACRSGFQPRLPETPSVRALIPLNR